MKDLMVAFYRLAAKGMLPAKWFEPNLPPKDKRTAFTGPIKLEIVSHCWNYSHLLVYQLSSLVLHAPHKAGVTMTVFYSEEDKQTAQLLKFFSERNVEGVRWNWRPLTKQDLFRRSIGRNIAALSTTADWVWFTDCDLVFHEGCLDALADLVQGRRDALIYPVEERCTELLEEDSPILASGAANADVIDVDVDSFEVSFPSRATGPLQITHGDVCRAVGYCNSIPVFQQPEKNFAKCHEDRVFRWLLGTRGVPVPLPGVYRIRHVKKGRYAGSEANTRLRTGLRKMQDRRMGKSTEQEER